MQSFSIFSKEAFIVQMPFTSPSDLHGRCLFNKWLAPLNVCQQRASRCSSFLLISSLLSTRRHTHRATKGRVIITALSCRHTHVWRAPYTLAGSLSFSVSRTYEGIHIVAHASRTHVKYLRSAAPRRSLSVGLKRARALSRNWVIAIQLFDLNRIVGASENGPAGRTRSS